MCQVVSIDRMVRLVVQRAAISPQTSARRRLGIGTVFAVCPGPTKAVRRPHRKKRDAVSRSDPSALFLLRFYTETALVSRAFLTAPPRACRVAAYRVSRSVRCRRRRDIGNSVRLFKETMEQETSHDVIVIGGGPAGATAATLLARQNHRVLLLEREKFPREHVGESLLPFCYCLLKDLGVVDEIKKNFVRKPGVRFIDRDGNISTTWCFDHIIKDETYLSFQVIRGDFDHILLKNAAKNGVEVREETKVIGADISAGDSVTVTSLDSAGRKSVSSGPLSGGRERTRRFHRRSTWLAKTPGGAGSDRDLVALGQQLNLKGVSKKDCRSLFTWVSSKKAGSGYFRSGEDRITAGFVCPEFLYA